MTRGPESGEADRARPRSAESGNFLQVIACGNAGEGWDALIERLSTALPAPADVPSVLRRGGLKIHGSVGTAIESVPSQGRGAREPEQNHGIDVPGHFFIVGRRAIVVVHAREENRNYHVMVAGASTTDAALIFVDASEGMTVQARRYCYVAGQCSIRQVAVIVDGMEKVEFSERRFREIEARCRDLATGAGLKNVPCIPVSALKNDNIASASIHMPWHRGATLLGWLETVDAEREKLRRLPFRLPVEDVDQPNSTSRRVAGVVAGGEVRIGDRVRVQPGGREARVASVVAEGKDLQLATAGQAVNLGFTDSIDVARGDMVSAADAPAEVADQFEATVFWFHDEPMLRGRTYLMQAGLKSVPATVAPLKYRINVDTLEHVAAEKLESNEIGVCELELDQPIAFDAYAENRVTGAFILIDRMTRRAVGAGMLRFALRRAHNIHVQHVDVDKAARSALKGQKACVIWLTGLSGAGKSTIANLVEKKLLAMGRHTYILDGDNVRHGLTKDLGFTAADRVENIRRIAEVAKLMVDAGLIVITAFISPFRAERRMARGLLKEGEFIEIFVDSTLSVAEQRDPKGLYKKARRGEIKNFTGIDSPYEDPESPEMRIDTSTLGPEEAANRVLAALVDMGIIGKS